MRVTQRKLELSIKPIIKGHPVLIREGKGVAQLISDYAHSQAVVCVRIWCTRLKNRDIRPKIDG